MPVTDVVERDKVIEAIEFGITNAWAINAETGERFNPFARANEELMDAAKRVEQLANPDMENVSDGSHTFKQLYYQRLMLFAVIVKHNKELAWKSHRHEDGELCFGGGWFIVGIITPEGDYTYHYEDKYWDLFDCKVLEKARPWDGHTEKDVTRLLSL